LMEDPRVRQHSLDPEWRRKRSAPKLRGSQPIRRWIPVHPVNPRQARQQNANSKAAGSWRWVGRCVTMPAVFGNA
jgi:hypothetical protein